MANKRTILILLFIVSILCSRVRAIVYGSDTVLSRQAASLSFPNTDSDNEMRGFTLVENGFSLQDASTTCTFNAYFPVSADITLNNGALFLNKDLLLENVCRVMSGGRVRSNQKCIKFPEYAPGFTVPVNTGVLVLDGTVLELNEHVTLGGLWRIRGACKIIGNGKKISLGTGNLCIELSDNARLTLQNIFLSHVGSYNIRCITDNGVITLSDSTLMLDRDYTFSRGALIVDRDVIITGTSKFTYQSSQTSTINAGAHVCFEQGMTFSYDPIIGNKNLLVMSDATSGLYLNGTVLYTTCTGLRLSTGTLYLDNRVTVSTQARNTGEAFEFGTNLNIQVLGGAVLDMFGVVKYV